MRRNRKRWPGALEGIRQAARLMGGACLGTLAIFILVQGICKIVFLFHGQLHR